ncbi:MAG: protein kinase domain-containing protein [Planctomycetota bacterium]|jgi:tetratricopeptide (TPR) repeat protein/predicted Ser/Thr protein kinase
MIGSQVGPYEILREMGRGGMGAVYRARRKDLNREFAVKFLVQGADDPRLRERFLREARAAAGLAGCPGIVTVHDAGEHEGKPYLVMDVVEGRSLEAVAREGELTPLESAQIMMKAARAMQHAHDAGVIHRDLKPANIMLADSRMPRITDFGLARVRALDEAAARLTRTNEVVGTPAFMPPEQVLGEAVTPASDIYALGATLYALCAGHGPFEADSLVATLHAVLEEMPPPLYAQNRSVTPALEAVVQKCLAKNPADRYPSAAALADDLERVLRGEATKARPSTRYAATAAARRVGPKLLSGALIVAAIAAVAWVVADRWRRSDRREAAAGAARDAGVQQDRGARLTTLYARLRQKGGAAMARCEDRFHGVPHGPAAADLESIAELRATLSAEERTLGLPAAWAGMARALAGEWEAGVAEVQAAARAAPDDPFPHLFLARLELAAIVKRQRFPDLTLGDEGIEYAALDAMASAAALRTRAESCLAAAEATPLWEAVRTAGEYPRYVAGVRALLSGDSAGAAHELRKAQQDPLLEAEAGCLAGIALQLQHRPAEAVAAWEPAAQRRWPRALEFGALAHLDAAIRSNAGGRASHERALAQLQAALDAGTDRLFEVHLTRGIVWHRIARETRDAGQSALEPYRRAAECYRAATDSPGANYSCWGNLSLAQRHVGMELLATGRDPSAAFAAAHDAIAQARRREMPEPLAHELTARTLVQEFEWSRRHGGGDQALLTRAIAEMEAALQTQTQDGGLWSDLGNLLRQRAQAVMNEGGDPTRLFQRAEAALGRADAVRPGHWRTRTNWGDLRYLQIGWRNQRNEPVSRRALEAALADFDAVLERYPDRGRTQLRRGVLLALLGELLERGGTSPVDACRRSLAALDEAIAARAGRNQPVGAAWQTHAQVAMRLARSLHDGGPAAADAAAAWKTARDSWRKVAEAQPSEWAVWARIGECEFRLEDKEAALTAFERALKLNPTHPELPRTVAGLRKELGR